MGATSSEVKNRYNKKVYSRWAATIKKDDFAKIEELREQEGMNKPEFLKMLIKNKYGIDM